MSRKLDEIPVLISGLISGLISVSGPVSIRVIMLILGKRNIKVSQHFMRHQLQEISFL